MFKPVDPKPDFPALERETLRWWEDQDIVQQYLRRNESSSERWSFIDGPITANNPMGVHHAWGRAYKDAFQRHKTMQGYRQRYQNGFDCQGLWIEVEVEKALGFTSKRDIESHGIDRFVEACKERVQQCADQITTQSVRLGYWMDWDNSYYTNSDENNYAIWHFLKVCHERGWLYKGNDVMPWCPRCATGLSNMEIVTEGYQELTHPSVFLKFPLNERPGEALLVWTTTPWTLAANVAAAVHPNLTYLRVRQGDDVLYLAKEALSVIQGDHTVEAELPGRELVGLTYRGPFDELPAQEGVVHRVIEWDEVSEEEGTGIVHIAPGCGQEDFALSKQFDLAVIDPIDEFGNYIEGFGLLEGRFAGEVGEAVFDSLREKGLLHRVEDYTHRYPVCWRCDSELVFRLVDEWFISMDELRHQIMEVTQKIRWIPEFGLAREMDWLRNMADWMISKKRYYGLALPIYPCSCGHVEVIGSRDELREKAIEGWDELDGHSPHRPWVDAVKIRCPQCGETLSRIEDVGNPWLDAGIVPFSTLKYDDDRSYWEQWFPAHFITESFPGQFRNWFYAMLAMGTALERREPFLSVLGHALVRDEHGEEMHKSKGNAIWFDDAAERMGVDVMRWLFLRHNPTHNVNFGWTTGDEIRRSFILTLWNSYAFFVTYANIDGWQPDAEAATQPAENELDRWLISELHQLIADVTTGLDNFDTMTPARRIESFVEDLSNWYVRRSRRRFWKSEDDGDKRSAYRTLHLCLVTLAKLMAPLAPFLAEELYQNLVRSWDEKAPRSIHLCDWPQSNPSLVDQALNDDMHLVMRLASLGRAARSKAGIKVRQPLPRMYILRVVGGLLQDTSDEDLKQIVQIHADELLEELNVKEISVGEDSDMEAYSLRLRPKPANIARWAGPDTQKILAYIRDLNERGNATGTGREILEGDHPLIPGTEYKLTGMDVSVEVEDLAGFSTATDGRVVVSLQTTISPALADEGLARELVHRIQNLRRDAGFDISDRITTYWQGNDDLRRVLTAHAEYIQGETLSLSLVEGEPPPDAHRSEQTVEGHRVVLGVVRTTL